MVSTPRSVAVLLCAGLGVPWPALRPAVEPRGDRLPGDPAALVEEIAPAELEERLVAERDLVEGALAVLARGLGSSDPDLRRRAASYVAACARANSRRLALGEGEWTAGDLELLARLLLVDVDRFLTDSGFQETVLSLLPQALHPRASPRLRDRLLYALNGLDGVDFPLSERLERAWGAALRSSLDLEEAYVPDRIRFSDQQQGAIRASLYSLPSRFFSLPEAEAFLEAVRSLAPGRTVLVLSDEPLRSALATRLGGAGRDLHLLDTYGRGYTPWPRDPLTLARASEGGVRILVRPNLQRGRHDDAFLGLELLQNLPDEVVRAWDGVSWTKAPVPFHNGHVLFAGGEAWISLHTLEPRLLQLLDEERVPVGSFRTTRGVTRYLSAARTAAGELAELYGRPIRFVHPLPEGGSAEAGWSLMQRIGGGAGIDLDAVLTLLPAPDEGPLQALVGDLELGARLLEGLSPEEGAALQRGYRLKPEPHLLVSAMARAQKSGRAPALGRYLHLLARHLEERGLAVSRLPLLLVPTSLLEDFEGAEHREFLITWNNVVVERTGQRTTATGFSGLIASGDREARRIFAEAGSELHLLPTLVPSVVLNGGYRCASNHLRASTPSDP